MEQLNECNLCGSTRHALFAVKEGRHTGKTFRIVSCRDWGLVFVNPRLTEAENQALYDEDYFNGKGFDASVNYVMLAEEEVARRQESLGIVAKIEALQPGKGARVLDVGCGTGSFLKVGKSDRGLKGLVFRTVGMLDVAPVRRLVSRVVGKGLLPIGVNRGA